MKKIILASTSPRRKELMKGLGIEFEIIPPSYDENLINKTFDYKKIENIAEKKCKSVIDLITFSAIVISADTVVICDNTVMGKPKDFNEAISMLTTLSGKTHKVVTAVCINDIQANRQLIKSETSEVTFSKLSKEEIINYINEYKPFDKAGSYGIQELPEYFAPKIKGEYNNIVGLPTCALKKMLLDFDINIGDVNE